MILHELTHIILCSIAAIIGYRYWRSVWVWIASFAAGFFVDLDHLLDYFIYKHSLVFNYAEFSSGNYFDVGGKIYLFLHSYEIVVACLAIAVYLYWRRKSRNTAVLLATIAISLIFHLAYDTFYYQPDWQTYFLSYRMLHRFDIGYFHFH